MTRGNELVISSEQEQLQGNESIDGSSERGKEGNYSTAVERERMRTSGSMKDDVKQL